MNFETEPLIMPIRPEVKDLNHSVVCDYHTQILSRIGKEFFPDEKNRIFKMELFHHLSEHSAVFQVNSLIEIDGESKERTFVPRKAKFFILNFSPNDHKFQIIQFHEIEGLLFDKVLKKPKKIKKDQKVFLEGLCPAESDLNDCPRLVNYFIFYNVMLISKKEFAVASFGQVFCFEGYSSDQYFKKGRELLEFSPEGYVWYYPTTNEISFGN